MAVAQFSLPYRPAFDSNGKVIAGAQLYFTLSGTSTPKTVYSDVSMSEPLPNPVVANAAGRFPPIYYDASTLMRARLYEEDATVGVDTPLEEFDPFKVPAAVAATPSLRDFEIAGDGTDVSSKINAAITQIQSLGGGALTVPPAIYEAAELLIPEGAALQLRGEGEHSVLRVNHATANVVTVNAWYSSVENLRIISTVTRTGGEYITLNGAHTFAERNRLAGDFNGIKMSGVGAKIMRNNFDAGAAGGRRIWATGGDTSQHIGHNIMGAQGPGVDAGIFVDNSVALQVYHNDIIGQGRCLHLAPGDGQSIFRLKSTHNFYDTAAYGIAVEPSGTGAVYRSQSVNDDGCSMSARGIQFTASGSAIIDGFKVIDFEANLNVAGIALAGANVKNVRMVRPVTRGNSDAGVSIGAGVTEWSIFGQQAQAADGHPANAYGVFIGAGANEYSIRYGDYRGQTTGAIVGHTETATKITESNRT